jgi:hypothetical protein
MLHVTSSRMGYVLLIFTQRACASNLLGTYYTWPQVTWARYLSCSHTAGTRAWLTVRLYMDEFSSNLRWTYYKSQQVARAMVMFTHRAHVCERACASARVRVRAWLYIHLSLDGFSSNLMGTYYKWPQVTWDTYISCSRTACMRVSMRVWACMCERVCASARVCERACASPRVRARMIKRSLISERILSKFGDRSPEVTLAV